MRVTAAIETTVLCSLVVLSQVSVMPDWTHMASLPFAFAVGAFLIWSMVQLLNAILNNSNKTTSDTISTLRSQVSELMKFKDDQMLAMVARVSTALEKDAEASLASVDAWQEVHQDFRDLITEMRNRPCLDRNGK
jgi:hypothetical protein